MKTTIPVELSSNLLTIDDVFDEISKSALHDITSTTEDILVNLAGFKFTGDDQTKDTRRPQGVAIYGDYVINSWYFTDNSLEYTGNCKLTVTSKTKEKYFNLVPVQLDGDKFEPIKSHAGGITVIENYLYLADAASIRIFDLSKINRNSLENTDFILLYDYMIPQVAELKISTPGGAHLSYLSTTIIKEKKYFLTGNFYSTVDKKYEKGGKAMIWLFPIETKSYPFPTIEINDENEYDQIEPLFPGGDEKGKTVTRIQGAIIEGNILIINRSYSDETKQLIVMEYDNILADGKLMPSSYFDGTVTAKHEYNHKNWLYGCEDLEKDDLSKDDPKIWTVTEFKNNRSVLAASYTDIIKLMM
jgi:hypothetical protein